MSGLEKLNHLSPEDAQKAFYRCCSSRVWSQQMAQSRPFKTEEDLYSQADRLWNGCGLADYLEAFSHHPRIGGDLEALRKKFESTTGWASQEQRGVMGAPEEVLQNLNRGNIEYEKKFGFVFLICATGKSAKEMLDALEKRLSNSKDQEILNAKAEQGKITRIRLQKLLTQGEVA